jgi:hypothetical protein
MWWDEFPCLALADDANLPIMQKTALATMARILGFDSVACQESACTGSGIGSGPMIGRSVGSSTGLNPDIDPRLLTYAKSARCGCVL